MFKPGSWRFFTITFEKSLGMIYETIHVCVTNSIPHFSWWHFHFWLSCESTSNICIHEFRNLNVWLYPFSTHTLLLKIVQEALGHCNFLAISWCKKLKRENFQLSFWNLSIHWEKYMVKKNRFLESVSAMGQGWYFGSYF